MGCGPGSGASLTALDVQQTHTCQGMAQRTSAGATSMRLVGEMPLSAALCTCENPGALSFIMHWFVKMTTWSCSIRGISSAASDAVYSISALFAGEGFLEVAHMCALISYDFMEYPAQHCMAVYLRQ